MSKPQHDEDMEKDVDFEEIEDSESSFKDRIKDIKAKLATVSAEKMQALTDLQKAKADFINMRKRDEETNKNYIKYAKEGLIADLLPVLDSFDMAFINKEAWEKAPKEWRVGVEYIYNQLFSVLQNNGISEIGIQEGDTFDHNIHDAVEMVSVDDETKDNKILSIVQKGYKLDDKIIRPAKVRVGQK